MGSNEEKFFESNMALLKEFHNKTWQGVCDFESSVEPEIFFTSEGKTNLKVRIKNGNNIHLHDFHDPEVEVPQFLGLIPENSNGVVLLTGIGLGYTPIAILKERKNIQFLAIFDLIPDIFVTAMQNMDLSPILTDPRVILSLGPDPDIEKILEPAQLALQLENIHDLKHVPSFSVDRQAYEKLSEKVFDVANQYNLGGGAVLGGGKVYTSNRFSHLTSMYQNCIIEELMDKFKGKPAIIVAGGPSLDKNIHLLSEAKNKAVIIAVDSVIPNLLANGIIPDFMTSIDPIDLIYEKFADVLPQMNDIALISSTWITPKIPKIFSPKKIFWTFSGRHMENWIMELLGGKVAAGGASTVAHLNLVAAALMGCSPIVFVGQDLAYAGNVSHAANTSLSEDEFIDKWKQGDTVIWTEEINGGKIPTDRLLLSYKSHFESFISHNTGNYINATAIGAQIKGTEPMDLEDVIDRYCKKPVNTLEVIKNAGENRRKSEPFLKEFRSFIKKSKQIFKEVNKTETLHKKVIKALTTAKNKGKNYTRFETLPRNIQKDIMAIDKGHKKIDGFKSIWSILDEITMAGLRLSQRQRYEIARLEKDPGQYTQWLLKNFDRLQHINSVRENELKFFTDHLSKLVSFYEKEKKILRQIENKNEDNDIVELADLYFESNDWSLLEQVCSQFDDHKNFNPSICFYKGCVHLFKNEFIKAESYFEKAGNNHPETEQRIRGFRSRLGDEYNGHADFFIGKDENTIRKMLIKGLKYGGQHITLVNRLNEMADRDLNQINQEFESEHPEAGKKLAEKWINDIDQHGELVRAIKKEKCAEFSRLYGSIHVKLEEFETAVKGFDKLLSFVSDNAEYHLLKADACFGMNDFDNGVQALNQAVVLDRRYAQYWENMGDNLAKKGNYNDALAAFEQNLLALPENRMVLKKISECYLKLGHVDAAKEALTQLKNDLKNG